MQLGQTSFLTNPGTVMVYTNSNTQMLNTSTPVEGGVFRFKGLIFDRSGTLRMDCAQVDEACQSDAFGWRPRSGQRLEIPESHHSGRRTNG
jgi:hypothetical protein